MDYEEELEQMQNEALAEFEGTNDDTNNDETGHEDEHIDTSNNEAEDGTDGNDPSEDGFENESDVERNKREDTEKYDYKVDEDNSGDDDDTTNSEDSGNEEDNSSFESVTVEVNGQEISLDTQEELLAFVKNKGTNSNTSRARKSKNDQIIEQGNLSGNDLQLFIDAKNGDANAIAKIAENANIDLYELNEDNARAYQPKFEAQIMTEVDEVAADIMADKGLHDSFQQVIQTVPDSFKSEIATNAKALTNFSRHVKSGLAQEIIPRVVKEQTLNGGDFMELYAKIGREISDVKKAPEKSKTTRKVDPRAQELKKRANNPKGSNTGTKTHTTGDDIWNMSSEDFSKKYM